MASCRGRPPHAGLADDPGLAGGSGPHRSARRAGEPSNPSRVRSCAGCSPPVARASWSLPLQDAGSWLGLLGVTGCLAAAWLAAHQGQPGLRGLLTCACGLSPLVAAARFRLPRSLSYRVMGLVAEAQRVRLHGVALRLIWRRSAGARHAEPRLRVVPARPHQGLLRIDVMVDSRPSASEFTLCVVVLSESSAARALAPLARRREPAERGGQAHRFRARVRAARP